MTNAATTAIDNVLVFDGDQFVGPTTVVIEGDSIVAVGDADPADERVDGTGKTLLPGLIDAHTHAFGTALVEALNWGVTTEIDMFSDWRAARVMRERQKGIVANRADLFSAGTLVTAAGGHGTQFGLAIPTLDSIDDVETHIAARVEEGSDFIKLVLDAGATYGATLNTLTPEIFQRAVSAAQALGKLAVVHVSTLDDAELALDAGADGLVHTFWDGSWDDQRLAAFADRAASAGLFVVPTLAVTETILGGRSGADVANAPANRPYLSMMQSASLNNRYAAVGNVASIDEVHRSLRIMQAAGVAILVGTDAPNPGTAHGISMHQEIDRLVRAGLDIETVLHGATAGAADAFRITDRGRIAPGMKSDLLLVTGDPRNGVDATRSIEAIWKDGVAYSRDTYEVVDDVRRGASRVSDFDNSKLDASFGAWIESTDQMAGGTSTVAFTFIQNGAEGSRGALRVDGEIRTDFPLPWAGPLFVPGDQPMQAVDLSDAEGITFHARGSGILRVMLFTRSRGQTPITRTVALKATWGGYRLPFSSFEVDGKDLMGVQFSPNRPGTFRFDLDEVEFY